jgi:uncharacterized repeat protein (TIGR03803 family)
MQATNGNFYGTTSAGGNSICKSVGCGTVYILSEGLGPFVITVPTSREVGQCVRILGTELTGATSVKFNGASASFTVVSATEITATVPAGATTGTVEVTTPSGTLRSNLAFRVFWEQGVPMDGWRKQPISLIELLFIVIVLRLASETAQPKAAA